MKSEISQKLPAYKEVSAPYMVVIDEDIILVDDANCGVCVHGPHLGNGYDEGHYDWSRFPLYKGKVTLSN